MIAPVGVPVNGAAAVMVNVIGSPNSAVPFDELTEMVGSARLTSCDTSADVLPSKFPVPSYTAVT